MKGKFKKTKTKNKAKTNKVKIKKKKFLCFSCLKEIEQSLDTNTCPLCNNKSILNERYYLSKVLGQNIGVTYKAFDIETDKEVVIKELSIKKVKNWKDEELFKREATTLLTINHPEIPDYIDYFETSIGKKIKYYTVMEFIGGDNLEIFNKKHVFTEKEVLEVVQDLGKILDYLHNLNPLVIHRDIKPSNIIKRKNDGKYVLIDFGSVVDALKPGGDSTIAGTFGYMAPEQFMGKATVKSDYYSLGVVALELLTNEKPEKFLSGIKLDWQSAKISDYMKGILSYLLTENPNDRIGNFNDLKTILGLSQNNNKLSDKDKFIKIYEELKKVKEIDRTSSVTNKASKFLIFSSSIAIFFYFIPSLIVMGISIITLYYSHMAKVEKQKEFLKGYFPYLTEKEVIFLEVILKMDNGEFSLRKKDFYSFYENAIEAGTLDSSYLIKYSKNYKDFDKFIKIDEDIL
jgi:serine/threonine protein kinase